MTAQVRDESPVASSPRAADVTVVIPVRDRHELLVRALRSVDAQTEAAAEVIVVDDGSQTPVGELARGATPIRVIRHRRPLGAAVARNTAIDAATTTLIAFLDSDDEWWPTKLERQLPLTPTEIPEVATVAGFWVLPRGGTRPRLRRPRASGSGRRRILRNCHVAAGSTLIAHRERLVSLGGFDPTLERFEDWDLLLRHTQDGTLRIAPEPLAVVHAGSVPDPGAVRRSLEVIERRHLQRCSTLGSSERRLLRAAVAVEWSADRARGGQRMRAAAVLARAALRDPWQLREAADRPLGSLRSRFVD